MIIPRLGQARWRTSWRALCVAGLVLAGCDQAGTGGNMTNSVRAEKQPAAAAPSVAKPVPETATPMQRAFHTVFDADSPFVDTNSDHGSDATITAEKLLWIGRRAVLVTSTYFPDGSHGTIGYLGVYYLAAAGDGFSVEGKWPEAVSGNGNGGEPESWSITDRFGDVKTLYSEAGWSGQGYTCSAFELTELAPGAPKSVARVPIYYDDLGTDKGSTTIEGKIVKIVPGKSFTVRYSGDRTFSETWTRKGDHYVLRGVTRMETC